MRINTNSHTLLQEVLIVAAHWKITWEHFIRLNMHLPYIWPTSSIPTTQQQDCVPIFIKRHMQECLQQYYEQQSQTEKYSNAHQQWNIKIYCALLTQWDTIQQTWAEFFRIRTTTNFLQVSQSTGLFIIPCNNQSVF